MACFHVVVLPSAGPDWIARLSAVCVLDKTTKHGTAKFEINQLENKTNMQVRQLRGEVRRVGGGDEVQSPWKQENTGARRWSSWVEPEQTKAAAPLHFHHDDRELG
jgi:hypothetical protein